MRYTNKKIENLIAERDQMIESYNKQIEKEIQFEKSKHVFDWKYFLITIGLSAGLILAIKLNEVLFSPNSIWSWDYWLK